MASQVADLLAVADDLGVREVELAPEVHPNQVYGGTRQCWCGTILCRYNPGPQCYVHADLERIYRRRIEAIRELRQRGENPLVLL